MDVTLIRHSPDPRIEAKAKGDFGELSGYASVFDVKDAQGDIVKRGAFAKSISERVAAGKVPLMVKHFAYGGDTTEVIGEIIEAKEDDVGLYITAKLNESQVAQETRQKVMDSSKLFGLSIGFQIVKSGSKKIAGGGYELSEVKLYEVTVTVTPANEFTTANAKSKEDLGSRVATLEAKVKELQEPPSPPEVIETSETEGHPESVDTIGAVNKELARQRRVLTLLGVENG